MLKYPHTETGMIWGLLAVGVISAIIWIRQSYRMGKFNKFMKRKNNKEDEERELAAKRMIREAEDLID